MSKMKRKFKRIVIGDVHGRWNELKDMYDREKPDEVIILGDYFDSFDIDAYTQRDCYENIIKLREEHLAKFGEGFHMLIGNHDMHYIDERFGRCSGWNPLTCSVANYVLCRDLQNGILKIVHVDETNDTIYSHAGVSSNWFYSWIKTDSLDDINTVGVNALVFTYRDHGDSYGSSSWNSPLWIRPEGLRESPFKDIFDFEYSQVFGHTENEKPYHWTDCEWDNKAEFYGIDGRMKYYLRETLNDQREIISREIVYLDKELNKKMMKSK